MVLCELGIIGHQPKLKLIENLPCKLVSAKFDIYLPRVEGMVSFPHTGVFFKQENRANARRGSVVLKMVMSWHFFREKLGKLPFLYLAYSFSARLPNQTTTVSFSYISSFLGI